MGFSPVGNIVGVFRIEDGLAVGALSVGNMVGLESDGAAVFVGFVVGSFVGRPAFTVGLNVGMFDG